MIKSWVNGSANQSISLTDRGLLYGDGFFTTIAVSSAKPLLWQQHLFRIEECATRLNLAIDLKKIEENMHQFLSETQLPERCVFKILVTRAESGRAYHWGENLKSNIIFQLFEYKDYAQLLDKRLKGLSLTVCDTSLSHNKRLAGLKHLNRLEQVLAASELDKTKVDEGLMLDSDGYVIEGTMSNIFILLNDKLLTPRLEFSGVAGVMRSFILQNLSSSPFLLKLDNIKLEQIYQADAIFMSNSLWGLCSVASIVGSDWRPNLDKVSTVLTSINFHEAIF